MFTGIVEETGVIAAFDRSQNGARLIVKAKEILAGLRAGDSIAVNGCCLTFTEQQGDALSFDLLNETLRLTNLGDLAPGSPVNLERALAADGRLGGHFVSGHIDCTSQILRFEPAGADYRLEIALPPEFAQLVVFKGSIAIDGMSLTVAEVGPESITVWIIPHTLAVTNLRNRKAGDRVNLEFDVLAKYLERMMSLRGWPAAAR